MINKHFDITNNNMNEIVNVAKSVFPNYNYRFVRLNDGHGSFERNDCVYYCKEYFECECSLENRTKLFTCIHKYLIENYSDKVIKDSFNFEIITKIEMDMLLNNCNYKFINEYK